ncbi:ATP phosphoribosyltransferase regulatory subunit [uncultured Enterovirga sp.]|uniref:ATP phosphoribosyltransferase regulatory subunit n=1 Tax=uncultured Enterovirga sp. TaxID=2026352 RepID=UPI0035CBFB08
MTRHAAGPGDALLRLFEDQGFERVETPVLQPAELFFDLSGEDIRRRLFLTQDNAGAEFCLRPEYTIPVCRQHVASGELVGAYCYLGPVFRQRSEGPAEFHQVGVESIGRADISPADADILSLALDGFALSPRLGGYDVRVGDMGLLSVVFAELGLAPPVQRRLIRSLAGGQGADVALEPDSRAAGSDYAGLLAAIEGQDPKAARAFVEDVISIAGISRVGGRSAGEIADRFLAKAENRFGTLGDREREVLRRYLAIAGDLDEAADAIRSLASDEKLDLAAALDIFDERTGFIAARGIDLARLRFAADFARTLDYYTGFIFEIRDAGRPEGWYVAAGGRYDRLLQHVGARAPVPAVGVSFWLDPEPVR